MLRTLRAAAGNEATLLKARGVMNFFRTDAPGFAHSGELPLAVHRAARLAHHMGLADRSDRHEAGQHGALSLAVQRGRDAADLGTPNTTIGAGRSGAPGDGRTYPTPQKSATSPKAPRTSLSDEPTASCGQAIGGLTGEGGDNAWAGHWSPGQISALTDPDLIAVAAKSPKAKAAAKFKKRLGTKAVKGFEREAAGKDGILHREAATTFRAISARGNYLAQDRADCSYSTKEAVSYTHLTLPTILLV